MKILIFFLIASITFTKAQSVKLEEVNSKNILELLKENPTKTESFTSKSEITQIGDKNTVEVYNKSKQSNIHLRQMGDYNTTYFINANKNSNPQTKVNVKGFNNHVDITGSNSISDKLIINLKTDNKMIFMRNY